MPCTVRNTGHGLAVVVVGCMVLLLLALLLLHRTMELRDRNKEKVPSHNHTPVTRPTAPTHLSHLPILLLYAETMLTGIHSGCLGLPLHLDITGPHACTQQKGAG